VVSRGVLFEQMLDGFVRGGGYNFLDDVNKIFELDTTIAIRIFCIERLVQRFDILLGEDGLQDIDETSLASAKDIHHLYTK
jgi:hypothetical protein